MPAALRLLGEICAGVSVLHRHGVVHRDLTPGNILFHSTPAPSGAEPTGGASGAERVLIADLGLAKALAAASGLTARAGTPGYMAPEQDDPGAVIDTRADVYGLGRLGIRLLAAAPGPDPPRSAGTLRLRDGVPARVTAVLVRATAHRPADRYPDAAALHAALVRATDPVRQSSPVARRPYRMLLAGAAVAAVAAVAVAGAEPGGTGAERDTYTAGPLTVTLPDGWSATGATWAGQYDADGEAEPALVMSPQPRRWAADPGVPGAFVGVSVSTAARTTPAGFLAERTHGDCTSAPVRTTRQAGVEWTVVTYRCDRDRPRIVESAGLHPARGALVYVQVVPPLDGGPDFVDGLLAGVRVR